MYRWRRARPRFGCEPEAAPRAAFKQLPDEETPALLEDADSSGPPGGYLLRGCMQVRRRQTPKFSIFHAGTVGHYPNHRYSQHQPMPGYSGRAGPPGVLPLPSNSFQGAEAQFNPDPQTIPTNTHPLWWQVSQQQPRFGLVSFPKHHQNPTAAGSMLSKSCASSYPPMAWSWHQCASGQTAAPVRLEGGVFLDPHERVPAQCANTFPETGTPQSTIGQHQYGSYLREPPAPTGTTGVLWELSTGRADCPAIYARRPGWRYCGRAR